jgi:hypothetical protein
MKKAINHGREKWGDLSDEDDKGKGAKGSEVTDNRFDHNDPRLYDRVPMTSNSLVTERNSGDPEIVLPGTNTLPTSPFKDGRAFAFVSEKEGHMNPNQTRVQESSSAAKSGSNRGEGAEENQQKWVNFLNNSPRNSKPNTPNREVESRSPAYSPGSHSGSTEPAHNEEQKDENMVDLTDNEGNPDLEDIVDRFSQEEREELFIETLIERNQNGELDSVEEVMKAILDIGGESLEADGIPFSFTARIALKLLQCSDPLGSLIKNYEERQDDMMRDQRKLFRDQMAYLHKKTLEKVGADTKAMIES